jgi:Ni,Fe-hydrogenase maturation factor
MQGGNRDVTLYAITIDPRQPISMELSPAGKRAATVAVERILAELHAEVCDIRA